VEGRAQEAQEVGATSSPVQALRSPVRLVGTRQSGRRGHAGVSLAKILTKLEFSKFFFWQPVSRKLASRCFNYSQYREHWKAVNSGSEWPRRCNFTLTSTR
jgi:hypothetical protein